MKNPARASHRMPGRSFLPPRGPVVVMTRDFLPLYAVMLKSGITTLASGIIRLGDKLMGLTVNNIDRISACS